MDYEARSRKTLIEASALLSWITRSGGSQHHILSILEQSVESSTWQETGLLTMAGSNLPPTKGVLLEVDPPALDDILIANL